MTQQKAIEAKNKNAEQVANCIDAITAIYNNGNKQNEIICFALFALVMALDETSDFYDIAPTGENDQVVYSSFLLFESLDKITETKNLDTNSFQLRLENNVLHVKTFRFSAQYETPKTTEEN